LPVAVAGEEINILAEGATGSIRRDDDDGINGV